MSKADDLELRLSELENQIETLLSGHSSRFEDLEIEFLDLEYAGDKLQSLIDAKKIQINDLEEKAAQRRKRKRSLSPENALKEALFLKALIDDAGDLLALMEKNLSQQGSKLEQMGGP
jgi:chromosome segregation ATPase